jgi:hypothetical protein
MLPNTGTSSAWKEKCRCSYCSVWNGHHSLATETHINRENHPKRKIQGALRGCVASDSSRARSASFALTYPVRVLRVGITGAALSAVPKRLEGFDQTVVRQRNGHSGQTMRTVLIVGSVMCIHISQRTSKFRCACRRFEDLQRRCQYVST